MQKKSLQFNSTEKNSLFYIAQTKSEMQHVFSLSKELFMRMKKRWQKSSLIANKTTLSSTPLLKKFFFFLNIYTSA
jgi:hypothetical protein